MQVDYVIKKSRRRTMSITVGSDLKVIVKIPLGMSSEVAVNFIHEKKEWIKKQISKVEKQKKIAVGLGILSDCEIRKLKKKARNIIQQRVEHYAGISGINYNRVFIRLQKTRWGSCSRDGNLNFNCLLVLMPLEILDSVVVHELCHRKYMNHSKQFYAEVEKIFPDYRKCSKWLKENGGIYFKRLGNCEEHESE